MGEEAIGLASMSLCLQIVHELAGSWSVHGLANRPVAYLPSLAASVEYARRECAAAPATIELMIDGLYVVMHQPDGWPRQPVAVQRNMLCAPAEELGGRDRSRFGRWYEWATGR